MKQKHNVTMKHKSFQHLGYPAKAKFHFIITLGQLHGCFGDETLCVIYFLLQCIKAYSYNPQILPHKHNFFQTFFYFIAKEALRKLSNVKICIIN